MVPVDVQGPSAAIGVVVGLATAVVQPMQHQEMSLLAAALTSPLGSGIIAALVAYGTIKTSVKVLERDMHEVKKDVKDIGTRVARIEGRIDSIESA